MRVVVLTNGSSHGAEILSALSARNIAVTAIIVQESNQSAVAKLRTSIRRYGYVHTAFDSWAYLRTKLTTRPPAPIGYEKFSDSIYRVSDPNGTRCVELIEKLSTDLLVLGGAPVLKAHVIQAAKVAVLNAHPGLLPKYRGVDVIAWALLNGDSVGVTVHRVDAGIDTGGTILQERVPLEKGDSMASLVRKSEILAGQLMADVVLTAITSGVVECRPPADKHALCKRMPRKLFRQVERELRDGTILR